MTSGAVDVPIDCAGRGTCGKCLVRIGAGSFSEPNEIERGKVPAEQARPGLATGLPDPPLSERVSIEVRDTRAGGRSSRPPSCTPARRTRRSCARPSPSSRRRSPTRAPTASACWPPLGARRLPLGVLRQLPADAARRRLARHGHPLRGRPIDVEPADATAAPTAWPSTSAPPRSSPTCSTWHRPADRPGGAREPPDALRRRRHHPHRAGHPRRTPATSCAGRPATA